MEFRDHLLVLEVPATPEAQLKGPLQPSQLEYFVISLDLQDRTQGSLERPTFSKAAMVEVTASQTMHFQTLEECREHCIHSEGCASDVELARKHAIRAQQSIALGQGVVRILVEASIYHLSANTTHLHQLLVGRPSPFCK